MPSPWCNLYVQGHIWLSCQPITFCVQTALVFFLLTACTQLTTLLAHSFLCIRWSRLGFKPRVHVWFRYKWDAKAVVAKRIHTSDVSLGKWIPDLGNQNCGGVMLKYWAFIRYRSRDLLEWAEPNEENSSPYHNQQAALLEEESWHILGSQYIFAAAMNGWMCAFVVGEKACFKVQPCVSRFLCLLLSSQDLKNRKLLS